MASLEHGRVPSPRPIAVKEVPLVDRTEEMNVLKEAVYQAVHGEGGLVFVHGEAGIGKTRLVRELGAYARARGIQVLYGRCPALFRMDGVPPYILWKEVIKDYLETCTQQQLLRVIGYYPAEVAKLVPELSQKLRTMPQSFTIGPEQEQNRLFEAVSQFITNIAQETPLLVVLDDLQWTDPSSLLLLHYLARGVQKTPLLLVGAYRSTDIDEKHPLTPVLAELNRERLPQEVRLTRMSPSDVSEMIRNILGQEDVPDEFCTLIYEKTRGNPFFAEEVVKSLKEEGAICLHEGKWRFKEITAIGFPKSVKSIVKARFSRLDDECQNVLTTASLVGNDFTLAVMAALTGVEENKLLEILDKLIKAGFVKHTVIRGEDICSFADVIMRDVVHEEIGPFKRKKLHRAVGEVLERVCGEKIDEHLGELALHFLEGGDKAKALSYFLKAGDKAAKVYANAEAVSYLHSALKLLEEKEGVLQEKARVLEQLGSLKSIAGEYDACLQRWNEASFIRNQLGERRKVAELHRRMAAIQWREIGKIEQAQENFEKALRILEGEPESGELAAVYAARASMSYFTEDITKAQSWAEKALELAQKLNNAEITASAYIDLGLVLSAKGEGKAGVECVEKALKIALDKGYMEIAGRAYNNLAASLPADENEQILECFEKGLELSRKTGHIQGTSWFEFQLAVKHLFMGNTAKAFSLAEESDRLARKIGNPFNLSSSTITLGSLYHSIGEWDRGEQLLEEALRISLETRNTQQIAYSYGYLGWASYDRGEHVKAKEHFDKMCAVIEETGAKALQIENSAWLATNYIELDELDKARTLLDELHKFAHEKQLKQLIADEDAVRASLLRAEEKWSESIEHFDRSLREFEALGARRWNVYFFAKLVLIEYARTYLERGQAGDKEKAAKLLSQALEIFQKMDAKKDIEKVEARIAFIETGRVITRPKPEEHVSTGLPDLDKLLHGGIPLSYSVVLTSPSCDERDLLIRSFLATGAKNGEAAFYVTINASLAKALAEEFGLNLQLFVCNPEAGAIITSLPNVRTLRGVENLTEISIALTSAIRQLDPSLKGARRICVGLVSDVLLQHHAVETRRWLSALMTKLKSENFTTLAVVDPKMHPSEELHAVLGLFEGEIGISEKEVGSGVAKFLRIKKMSNRKYLEDALPLEKRDLRKSK